MNLGFQTFFVSREYSKCPLVPEIVKMSRNLKTYGISENCEGVVSIDYGKRMLINGFNVHIDKIKERDMVEIVDYDPMKKNALTIGVKYPHIETPVHWLIHHAREDIHVIVQVNDMALVKQNSQRFPCTKTEYQSGSFELAKAVLKLLQKDKRIVIKNQGVLCVGWNLNKVIELIKTIRRD